MGFCDPRVATFCANQHRAGTLSRSALRHVCTIVPGGQICGIRGSDLFQYALLAALFEGAPIHSILDTASIRTFFWSPQPAKKLILRKAEQSYHRAETIKHCEMGWPFLCRVSPQLICQRIHVHQVRCGVSIYTCILARGLRKPSLEERNFSSCRLLIDCCNLLENSMQSPCKSSSSFSTNSVHRSRRRIPSSTLNEKRRYHQRIGCRACGRKHTLS